ncbi:ATP-dependent DNA helicase 2 subunit KU70 isoform X2 [Amborella trichopoda]|uniref:ATP-dependent DNA helicase 2 subunit KU70 isoform X2 n=1 Tax=Amborella trichopoda TaxID=13333 RepID=UPI0009C0158E|nr:ATP-dependent DNA helicase 2 subunit KU70 isoform X2 [Amborella trichopoda]|eukprot:XP_020526581.1 ATP-dependent DNA helicase 2 subunit KU70 isoform X2 [Amborella trichopoda]
MDYDPDNLFRDDEEDPEGEFFQERESSKEFVVYLIDARPEMLAQDAGKSESHFHAANRCITESLKTLIINRDYDEKEKKNMQDLDSVYVFNVPEREELDRPTARLIKEFSHIEEKFLTKIGSRNGIIPMTRENSLYNAIWVSQGLLRRGSSKNVDKRILLFTNEDDPFRHVDGATKSDMIRTTLQRAKDVQDLSISIELFPMCRPGTEFNTYKFYAELLGLEGEELSEFLPLAAEKIEDMVDQLKKRIFKKRVIRRMAFLIHDDMWIELNSYALIRPTSPGVITWLDSVSNTQLKSERSFICADTGTLLQEPMERFHLHKNEIVRFSLEELSEVKRISSVPLFLLGFKPTDCLKDYHNLKPSTFLYPSDEEIDGSTCIFVALYRAMLKYQRFALAFFGSSTHPQLVALVAQDDMIRNGVQLEPPGMHMIYLPYCNDIRSIEELQNHDSDTIPRATDDQIEKAMAVMKKLDLKEFSISQFANPALQRHYALLQVLALGDDVDELPEINDETLPDEEGMRRPGVVNALEGFKAAVYGENHDAEEAALEATKSGGEASKKRKAETAVKEAANYNWDDLAESGKLKDLTMPELKNYLAAHNLPVTGKKDALISRILTHLGK